MFVRIIGVQEFTRFVKLGGGKRKKKIISPRYNVIFINEIILYTLVCHFFFQPHQLYKRQSPVYLFRDVTWTCGEKITDTTRTKCNFWTQFVCAKFITFNSGVEEIELYFKGNSKGLQILNTDSKEWKAFVKYKTPIPSSAPVFFFFRILRISLLKVVSNYC